MTTRKQLAIANTEKQIRSLQRVIRNNKNKLYVFHDEILEYDKAIRAGGHPEDVESWHNERDITRGFATGLEVTLQENRRMLAAVRYAHERLTDGTWSWEDYMSFGCLDALESSNIMVSSGPLNTLHGYIGDRS